MAKSEVTDYWYNLSDQFKKDHQINLNAVLQQVSMKHNLTPGKLTANCVYKRVRKAKKSGDTSALHKTRRGPKPILEVAGENSTIIANLV